MKVYDVVLTKEQAEELETNLYNTKILHAVIECRFKPLFGFLDRRGEVASALEKIFPDDDPHKGNLNIEMAIESVKLENPNTLTESCFQVNRAFFNRQSIVPTTLNHFSKIAKEHLILYKTLFPEIEELGRFGFRTKQLTRIKEEEVNSARSKFNSQIIGVNPLFQRLKTNNLNIKCESHITTFKVEESYSRNDKVHSYSIRFQLGLSNPQETSKALEKTLPVLGKDDLFFHTDLDFALTHKKDRKITIDDAIAFCNQVTERAEEIHQIILGVISNG